MEKYGTQAIGTAVRVNKVTLHPAQGKGAIEGLTVANPKGYGAPHIISLGAISIRLDPRSLAADPAVIDDIRITSPLVVYEMNEDRVANVDVLKKNLGADRPSKTAGRGKKSAKEEGKRLRIRRLVIESARADVRISALGGKPRTVTLSRIEMKDIGGTRGATPEQVAKQIVTAIVAEATREVGKAGAERLLEKGLERMLRGK